MTDLPGARAGDKSFSTRLDLPAYCMSVNLSESMRSVRALHLFNGAQTETVRLLLDASSSFKSLNLTLTLQLIVGRLNPL